MTEVPEELCPARPVRTARLLLRAFTAEELEAAACGTDLAQFDPEFPSPEDQDWARGALDAGAHFHTESMYTMLATVDVATGQVIGTMGFVGPPIDHELEVVGSVVPSKRGRGYAKEGLRALVTLAFLDPEVTAVQASVTADNQAARKVLLSQGFHAQSQTRGTEYTFVHPRP